MPRIAGVDVPKQKQIWIALTYIYGIGKTTARTILEEAGIPYEKRAGALTEQEIARIQNIIFKDYKVEGDLRKEVSMNIKRLIEIGSYRGLRHRRGLPVRGQRTHTNARTRKGPRKTVAGKKKAPSPK
ncbi:MAG: 30S ribosomal protein S13 [Desulfobacterota bacterium]|nr:30S ribosomal protein S13 [Thermodesulfobacteriota bacterium]